MDIKVNNELVVVEDGTTISKLAEMRNLPSAGVAVAVNAQVVPRRDWAMKQLVSGDEVTIITAAYGG